MFVITKPDVFKSPQNNTYIIFGEAKIEDLRAKDAELQQQQGGRRQQSENRQQSQQFTPPPSASVSSNDEGPVDETGVDPKDIELVTTQASCSRAAAVKALRNNDNDIVNAIMELTM